MISNGNLFVIKMVNWGPEKGRALAEVTKTINKQFKTRIQVSRSLSHHCLFSHDLSSDSLPSPSRTFSVSLGVGEGNHHFFISGSVQHPKNSWNCQKGRRMRDWWDTGCPWDARPATAMSVVPSLVQGHQVRAGCAANHREATGGAGGKGNSSRLWSQKPRSSSRSAMDTESKSLPFSGPQSSHLKKGLMVIITESNGDARWDNRGESDLRSTIGKASFFAWGYCQGPPVPRGYDLGLGNQTDLGQLLTLPQATSAALSCFIALSLSFQLPNGDNYPTS